MLNYLLFCLLSPKRIKYSFLCHVGKIAARKRHGETVRWIVETLELIGRKALEKELVGKAMDVIDSLKTIMKVAGENEGSLWLSICEKEKGKR